MSRTAAKITQADAARVLRAAKQVGAKFATVKVGEIEIAIDLREQEPAAALSPMSTVRQLAPKRLIRL
jgi:hypothetical protein